jgi:hypothetical protein
VRHISASLRDVARRRQGMSAQTAETSSAAQPIEIGQPSFAPPHSAHKIPYEHPPTSLEQFVKVHAASPPVTSLVAPDRRNTASPPHPSTPSFHIQPSHPTINDLSPAQLADVKPAIQAKKGRDGFWRMAASNGSYGEEQYGIHASETGGPSTPVDSPIVAALPPVSNVTGIKLNFKRPTPATPVESLDGRSRDGTRDSPGSVDGGSSKKRRRILE